MKKSKLLWVISLLIVFSLGCGLISRTTPATESAALSTPTRTPLPTFTPVQPTQVVIIIPTPTETPLPTATPVPTETPVPTDTPPPPAEPTATPVSAPQVSMSQVINVRSGPGTGYARVGQVDAGDTSDVLGRNNDASWVMINYSGGQGWVFAQLTTIQGDVNSVGVVEVAAAPPPAATNTPVPAAPAPAPEPAGPTYPFKLTNMFGEKNGGITQVRGYIKDMGGQPYNGARVRVRSGSFCTVSVPSGKPGVYPSGNYDVLLDARAKDGNWQVSIVDKPTNPEDFKCDPGAQLLSEEVDAKTTTVEGVVYVEFQQVR